MDDKEIMAHIDELIDTEHQLRRQLAAGELTSQEERERLRSAEEALDQCWDLLRQRRARREFGENPEEAQLRPGGEAAAAGTDDRGTVRASVRRGPRRGQADR